jgi:hypothetical protein
MPLTVEWWVVWVAIEWGGIVFGVSALLWAAVFHWVARLWARRQPRGSALAMRAPEGIEPVPLHERVAQLEAHVRDLGQRVAYLEGRFGAGGTDGICETIRAE